MEGFFDGLEQAVREQNWHAALAMSLTLPDVCVAAAATNGKTTGKRYVQWFDQHLRPTYTYSGDPVRGPLVFLTGDDCYALRCALLHEGSTDITGQSARKVLDRFSFCTPGRRNNVWHCNKIGNVLILMVDRFATDVLAAARSWWASLTDEQREAARQRQVRLIDSDTLMGM